MSNHLGAADGAELDGERAVGMGLSVWLARFLQRGLTGSQPRERRLVIATRRRPQALRNVSEEAELKSQAVPR